MQNVYVIRVIYIYINYSICHYLIFDIGYKTVVASNMHTLDIGGV